VYSRTLWPPVRVTELIPGAPAGHFGSSVADGEDEAEEDEEPHGIFGRNVISPAGIPISPGLATISGGPVYFIYPGSDCCPTPVGIFVFMTPVHVLSDAHAVCASPKVLYFGPVTIAPIPEFSPS
jgi:hypothetical protein